MNSFRSVLAVFLACSIQAEARQERQTCGTHAETFQEQLQLHRQSSRTRVKRLRSAALESVRADQGNIALLDDTDGVASRRNPFNLNGSTLRFTPVAGTARYRYEKVSQNTYDSAAAPPDANLNGLGDDDTREVALPFSFPFYGARYDKIFVNSDGNLTLGSGDPAIATRSLGRMAAGSPRFAAAFTDLDPTRARGGVRTSADSTRMVVTWVDVPEYSDFGNGPIQRFQIRLFSDGRIEFAYASVTSQNLVVGLSPGGMRTGMALVSFTNTPSAEYPAMVAERFAGFDEIDTFAATQKFYLNHDDAYDFVVFFNNLNIDDPDAVATTVTVRNKRSGYGDVQVDIGAETGSKKRLQAIINMNSLSQYPRDPNERIPARSTTGDTTLTTLAHEAGHLFLAYASVRDAGDPDARPMLGYQFAHWNFAFNSEASLLEGNRIRDNGPGVSPRFQTIATVQGYAPLDQYLMGFRPPSEVPDTFLVVNPTAPGRAQFPRVGVSFDGERRNITVDEIIAAEGRRIPDHTVAQRRFRFAFVLITAAGVQPSADQIQQLEAYRTQFETFFNGAASSNAEADAALRKTVRLSVFPAAGVLAGATAKASVSIDNPMATPLTVVLQRPQGFIEAPASVAIAPGSTQAEFEIRGMRAGVAELRAAPADSQYDVAVAKIQVSEARDVRLALVAGDRQVARPGMVLAEPLRLRVTDANDLPYPGITVQAGVSGGGTLNAVSAVTDEDGAVSFQWTPGGTGAQEVTFRIGSGATVTAAALSGRPAIAENGVVNAASYSPGLVAGSIATVFGSNLADANGTEVLINGAPARVFYATPRQVNFLVPGSTAGGTAEVSIRNAAGTSTVLRANVTSVQPGVFFDTATGIGAVLMRSGFVEIYATGLGATAPMGNGLQRTAAVTDVTIGGQRVEVLFSGLAPGFEGLYQINARLPQGLRGLQPLVLTVGGNAANPVNVNLP